MPRNLPGAFRLRWGSLLLLVIPSCQSHPAGKRPAGDGTPPRVITVEAFADRVRGSLYGQWIGAAHGMPYEGRAEGSVIGGPLEPPGPERLAAALERADVAMDGLFVQSPRTKRLDDMWLAQWRALAESSFPLTPAGERARSNLRRGILPPWSGLSDPDKPHADIDFRRGAELLGLFLPVHSDFLGLSLLEFICHAIGRSISDGEGILAGAFVAGMTAEAAMQEDPPDIPAIVEGGLAYIPPDCATARLARIAQRAWRESPEDWWAAWRAVEAAAQGAAAPCCVGSAPVNTAYVVIALLYGGGDPARTIEIAVRCGRASEGNAAAAGGVLGAWIGHARMAPAPLQVLPEPLAAIARPLVDEAGKKAGPAQCLTASWTPPTVVRVASLDDAVRERIHEIRLQGISGVPCWRSGSDRNLLPCASEGEGRPPAYRFEFKLDRPSRLAPRLFLRRAPGAARVRVELDGRPLGSPVSLDRGSPGVMALDFDFVPFDAGPHALRVVSDNGRPFGVYAVDLLPPVRPILRWRLSPAHPAPGDAGLQTVFPPESAEAPERSPGWTDAEAKPDGTVDVEAQRTPKTDAVAYAVARLTAREAFDTRLHVGSDDGVMLWLNGSLIHRHHVHRACVGGDDVVPARFEAGEKRLLLKLEQGAGAWQFVVGVEDAAERLNE